METLDTVFEKIHKELKETEIKFNKEQYLLKIEKENLQGRILMKAVTDYISLAVELLEAQKRTIEATDFLARDNACREFNERLEAMKNRIVEDLEVNKRFI
jgi:NADPH-dependent 7-cyano-7-deazaguanine reductase QueF